MADLPPHLRAGRAAESAAAEFLQGQGLRVVARNLRLRRAEIDLLAWQDDVLVICEVRWRRSPDFGGALGSIDGRKRARLRHAAACLLAGLHPPPPARIDLLCAEGPPPWGWTWIQGI